MHFLFNRAIPFARAAAPQAPCLIASTSIIVGARCAGAPLAIHLARAGQRVLLLDAAKLPSDQPMSTHFVAPIGVEWLDDLGVGAEVRRLSFPSRSMRLDLDGDWLDVPFQRGRRGPLHPSKPCTSIACCARCGRTGGGDLAPTGKTKVVGLLRERGRVVGVEAVHEGGGRSSVRASSA